MRPFILSIAFAICFFQFSQGQSAYSAMTKEFTDSIFSKAHKFGKKLIVAERLDSSYYNSIRLNLEKGVFLKRVTYDKGKTIIIDTFALTGDEVIYIDSCLKSSANSVWTDEYISNAIILCKDTVDNIYAKHVSEIDSYLWKNYGDRRIFFLSKPIFLRGNTICIFEDDMDCGVLCGGGDLVIYKKDKGGWSRYITLASWVE
jgi:hypothetical protein